MSKKDERCFLFGKQKNRAKRYAQEYLNILDQIFRGEIKYDVLFIYRENTIACIITLTGFLEDYAFKGIAKLNTKEGDIYSKDKGEELAFGKAYAKVSKFLSKVLNRVSENSMALISQLEVQIHGVLEKKITNCSRRKK